LEHGIVPNMVKLINLDGESGPHRDAGIREFRFFDANQ
jgi:hypothetical protein